MSGELNLTAEEQVVYERLGPLFEAERLRMAKALSSKADSELFGANEYEVREQSDNVFHHGAAIREDRNSWHGVV